jgi:hypothetical protein
VVVRFKCPPDYAPVDEEHVHPESSYALSKILGRSRRDSLL